MVSFKQYLLETEATPSNVDDSFKVGHVKFDNRNGMGAVPNNANVEYMGAVVWMRPSQFRKLVTHADRTRDAGNLEKELRDGKSMGCPFLQLRWTRHEGKPESVVVVGHEGRARSDAFKAINGDVSMPVHFFCYGEVRARDMKENFWKLISETGLVPEDKIDPIPVSIDRVFVAGKEIHV
jgi:hypothetical protein